MKSLNEVKKEIRGAFTEEDLIELHKLGKSSSGFKSFKKFEELKKQLFGEFTPPDIEDALQQIATAKDFAHYVLIGREKDMADFSKYKLDLRFDKSKLGY